MKDQTEIGLTGLPIPRKKLSPKNRHEFEKKRRRHLGPNVGGYVYKKDVNPYFNPRQKTYEQFIQEGKELRRQLAATYYQSSVENGQPKIVDYGDHPPGSPERKKAIEQMMQSQGGKAVRQNVNKLKKQAKRAARQILKNQ